METKIIKELSHEEIKLKLKEKHNEQMDLRLKNAVGQIKKPHLIKKMRRTIARLETQLKQKN